MRPPGRLFLVFNQELATLLKAGMPLVQSLDLLKRRVTSPIFRRVLDDELVNFLFVGRIVPKDVTINKTKIVAKVASSSVAGKKWMM